MAAFKHDKKNQRHGSIVCLEPKYNIRRGI